jgi:hypothetical protein
VRGYEFNWEEVMFVYIIQTENLMMYRFIILLSLHNLCIKVKTRFVTNLCHLEEVLAMALGLIQPLTEMNARNVSRW